MSHSAIFKNDSTRALLDRARRYCALAEQCESGVRQKLIAWDAKPGEIEAIVDSLRSEDYLNDVRYACAYARDKFVGQRWGRQKVLYQLRLKHLPSDAIEAGLAAIDEPTYQQILDEEVEKKMRSLGGEMTRDVRRKMAAFLTSRGYTTDEIMRALGNE